MPPSSVLAPARHQVVVSILSGGYVSEFWQERALLSVLNYRGGVDETLLEVYFILIVST